MCAANEGQRGENSAEVTSGGRPPRPGFSDPPKQELRRLVRVPLAVRPAYSLPPATKDKVTSSTRSETAVKHRAIDRATCYVRDSVDDVLGLCIFLDQEVRRGRSSDRISTHVFLDCQPARCIQVLASYATCCERSLQASVRHSPQVTTNYSRNVLRNNVGKGNAKISLEERDSGSFQFPFTGCR